MPDRGRSLKKLHRPNLLEVGYISFKKKPASQDYAGSTLIAINAGLLKPRKGFATVTGNKNWGWVRILVEINCFGNESEKVAKHLLSFA